MTIWDEIKELNAAQAKLDATMGSHGYVQPWGYCGDIDIREGGTATRVDRMAGYATVVECTDLGSAIGQADCALIETGSVLLAGGIITRRRIRSALSSFGWTAADLLQFPRAQRADEMARALWVYGARDTDLRTVIRHGEDTDADDDEIMGRGYMEVDEIVAGQAGLAASFMEALT